MRTINIGGDKYQIQYSPEVADEVLEAVINWMEDKKHYSAWGGEGIMQNDECQIDAPLLIADIVDDILKPECIDSE